MPSFSQEFEGGRGLSFGIGFAYPVLVQGTYQFSLSADGKPVFDSSFEVAQGRGSDFADD